MKKKVFFLTGLIAIGLCNLQGLAVNNAPIPVCLYMVDKDNLPTEYERILLHGSFDSSIGPNAIVAGASETAVYIGFNEDLGNLNIAIYNGMGNTVYSTVVNTSVETVVIIPFVALAPDTYTLELSNATGYAEGDFNKN